MAGKNLAEDPCEALANGIVLQAVNDYRMALKKLIRNPRNQEAMQEAMEIERFFRSGWYSTLSDVDGEFLIERLREEMADGL